MEIKWLSSKGGNEFVTTSTDGFIYWWDIKKLIEPIEKI